MIQHEVTYWKNLIEEVIKDFVEANNQQPNLASSAAVKELAKAISLKLSFWIRNSISL